MLRITNESDLLAMGLSLDPTDPTKIIKTTSTGDVSECRSLDDLVAKAKALRAEIDGLEKDIKTKRKYLTAKWWQLGRYLLEIKNRCEKKGDWIKALESIGSNYQRAHDAIGIAKTFNTVEEAGKMPVRQALKKFRKANPSPEDDCFATPDWLFDRLNKQYNFALDAAAVSHNTKCPIFISPEMDALKQNWGKWSNGGAVFCNPPFSTVGKWVEYGWQQAQSGITVVMIVPLWQSQDWFKEYVWGKGECRCIGRKATYKGTGKKDGVAAGYQSYGANSIETIVVIFRRNQDGFKGEFVFGTFAEEEARAKGERNDGLNKSYDMPLVGAKSHLVNNSGDEISTVIEGDSGDLILAVSRLYFAKGQTIADVTYGKGVFWRRLNPADYQFRFSDLHIGREGSDIAPYDCRKLPYDPASLDVVAFDPPFGDLKIYQHRYETSSSALSLADVEKLYRDGMKEAERVLRPGGLLLVKCQDAYHGGKQWRMMISTWRFALDLGMRDVDRFILLGARRPIRLNGEQRTARKMESYLWVFRKPKRLAICKAK